MSVNAVQANGGRLTLQGDYVVYHQDGVDFSLEGDRVPSNLIGNYTGDMFITNLKLIFVNSSSAKGYQTFSMDFQGIRNVEVKQPIFGANFLKGFVKSEPNGGWEGNANFKIVFPKGGAIEFADQFQRAVNQSSRYRQNGMAPPPPQPAFVPQQGYYQPAGYYAQPGFYPQDPMQNGAYYPPPQGYGYPAPPGGQPMYAPTAQAPPPYPYNQAQAVYSTNPKAQEAYMSGNNVYVPNEAPPPYNPNYEVKKDQ
ncbi:WW domain-binding protein 2 isoform X2 [Hydra vulgaris]|uniref:WW domain-binding protein 2 isoform X2 n=1 Tax=Hydra vulgaris TaxID=6087 RepID=A0ABM4CDZ2_HYDVU